MPLDRIIDYTYVLFFREHWLVKMQHEQEWTTLYLRNFELVETVKLAQDWQIQVRKRLSGKLAGNLYKVFVRPDGVKYYSLGKARAGGFTADYEDGRKRRQPKTKGPKGK